jgi:FKBP-type peptidyl-prolyl cis-trans isomerase
MGNGAKATVIIPSALAYGASEMGNGAIPAYSTLVFEMELVGIKKAKK